MLPYSCRSNQVSDFTGKCIIYTLIFVWLRHHDQLPCKRTWTWHPQKHSIISYSSCLVSCSSFHMLTTTRNRWSILQYHRISRWQVWPPLSRLRPDHTFAVCDFDSLFGFYQPTHPVAQHLHFPGNKTCNFSNIVCTELPPFCVCQFSHLHLSQSR